MREMMEFREVISNHQQLEWYQNLDQKKDKYFVFATSSDLVGLIHLKNCTNESAEAGLFVGNENYIGTGVAFYASLALLDLAFFEMQLKKVEAKVNKENINTIRYNSFFGFQQDTVLNESFIRMVLEKENYTTLRGIIEQKISP